MESEDPKKETLAVQQRKCKPKKSPSSYNFNCVCGKNFTYKHHFNAHRKKVHNDSINSNTNPHHKHCPLCDFSAKFRDEMIKHYEVVHNISFIEEKYVFANQAEFLLWKSKIESDTNSKYVNKGTQKFLTHKVTHFYCHRSGYYVSKGKGIRSLKTQGSNKMNSFCPSRMLQRCLDKDGTCIIYFSGTHVGHQNELKYLTLTPAEKEELAKKIALKIPFDDILDQVRGSIYDRTVQRIHLLTRTDLDNIARRYNLQSKAIRRKDDAISEDAWISEMENEEAIEENSDSLVIAESKSDKNCESAICKLSKSKPVCQDVNKRKEKFQKAILETLGTISTIEEIEVLENIFSQAIRDKTLQSLQSKKYIVPQRGKRSPRKQPKKNLHHTSTEINENAVGLLIKNNS